MNKKLLLILTLGILAITQTADALFGRRVARRSYYRDHYYHDHYHRHY